MMRTRVSDAKDWNPDSLRTLADAWEAAAGQIQAEVVAPDLDSTGAAATAAQRTMSDIVTSGTEGARRLVAAAAIARSGAEQICAARQSVLDAVAAAEEQGFDVGDDGTVSPTARADQRLRPLCGDPAARELMLSTSTTEFSRRIGRQLDALAAADAETTRDITAQFDAQTEPRRPDAPPVADIVADWPTMSQDRIAAQIAALTPAQRDELVGAAPHAVGNTDGVPWPLRIAANRINIADAILAARRTIDRPVDEKIAAVVAQRYGSRLQPFTAERAAGAIAADANRRTAAIAEYDRDAMRHIGFYQSLLSEVADPTGRGEPPAARQILAFDPARSSLVELCGDLSSATSLGVLVPGLNTTMLGSAADVDTVRGFTAAGHGEVAMISYLGGPFPTGNLATGLLHAADPRYALEMAPRLVAFSEDVDRTADAHGIAVTYLGHSYGGSILGTAERLGLTADRTVYVEAAGAGVGVYEPGDWHNRNPAVARFAMTAPGDPIQLVQGLPLGTHGADPDDLPGVTQLGTGRRSDGSVMGGLPAHGDVLNEPSDAWRALLGVITGRSSR